MKYSPIRNPSNPAFLSSTTESGLFIPLSDILTKSEGI
jgi:hypothetical protein